MKLYEVNYDSPSSSGYDTFVLDGQSTVERVKAVMAERIRCNPDRITIRSCREVSLESLRVKDLTVGDLLRLIKGE
jgi:hypothetical protein